MELDHIAVAGRTLADATSHVEAALGTALQQGGEHDVFNTHNRLLGLADGLYLEAIATNPAAPRPDRPRWFDLDRFSGPPRLTNWICRCDHLEHTLAALPYDFGTPVTLRRGTLEWRMAVPASGQLPFDNCAPALMSWCGDQHPSQMLGACDLKLDRFQVSHPDALALQDLLRPFLHDTRIRFVSGPPGLRAEMTGPNGARVLE